MLFRVVVFVGAGLVLLSLAGGWTEVLGDRQERQGREHTNGGRVEHRNGSAVDTAEGPGRMLKGEERPVGATKAYF